MPETIIIATSYPCCDRPARLRALVAVPRETYRRRCAACETTWHVERRTTQLGTGIRLDRLDWLDTADRVYQRRYAP